METRSEVCICLVEGQHWNKNSSDHDLDFFFFPANTGLKEWNMMCGMRIIYSIRLLNKFSSLIKDHRKTSRKKSPYPFLQFFWKACDGKTRNLREGKKREKLQEIVCFKRKKEKKKKKDEIMSQKMLLLICFNAAFAAPCQSSQPLSTTNSVFSEMIRHFQCIYSVTMLYKVRQL